MLTRKPLCAWLSFACLLLALPVGRLASVFFTPTNDLLGYGGLDVAIIGFLLTLSLGTILAAASLLRQERFRPIALLCLLSNASLLTWVLCNLPEH